MTAPQPPYTPFIGTALNLQWIGFEGPLQNQASRHGYDIGLEPEHEADLPSALDTADLIAEKLGTANAEKYGATKDSVVPDASHLVRIRNMNAAIINNVATSGAEATFKHSVKTKYRVVNEVVCHKHRLGHADREWVLPVVCREAYHLALIWAHLKEDGSHNGRDATYTKLTNHFSKQGISKDLVAKWIKKCGCQQHKSIKTPLHPYPVQNLIQQPATQPASAASIAATTLSAAAPLPAGFVSSASTSQPQPQTSSWAQQQQQQPAPSAAAASLGPGSSAQEPMEIADDEMPDEEMLDDEMPNAPATGPPACFVPDLQLQDFGIADIPLTMDEIFDSAPGEIPSTMDDLFNFAMNDSPSVMDEPLDDPTFGILWP